MNIAQNSKAFRDVIDLIPVAGTASRIAPLPCSKELYPVGFRSVNGGNEIRPKVVIHYLLKKMRLANNQYEWLLPLHQGSFFCSL
ncbi:MAG: hypothetical protein HS132_06975 [Planctomycetia bacterium]|nr:hypothetical protein [Planctomycetia bacterium]